MMMALSLWQGVLVGGAALGILLLIVFTTLVGLPRFRRRRGGPDIPSGMRAGPTDQDLEKPILERLQAWGVLLIVIMAVWIPVVWLQEPKVNAGDLVKLQEESVLRGHLTAMPGNEENQFGFNCERCHGEGLGGGQNVFNGNIINVPNLQTVCGGTKYQHPQITSVDDIVDTIARGRPGTDMPSWSVLYAGAMNDQQIADLVNYIISIQTIPEADNLCLDPSAGAAAPSPGASASPSPGSSPSAVPGQGDPSPSPSPGGGGALALSAQNVQFSTATLAASANQPFQIEFDNQDAGIQHNVAIFEGADPTGAVAFRGDLVTGPDTITYEVSALEPGSYYFHCDVHPAMTGTLTVG